MRSAILLGGLASIAFACDNPDNDACANAFTVSSAVARPFCATYTQSANTVSTGLPAFATACASKPKKLSSACSCLQVATTLATVAKSSSVVAVSSVASSSAAAAPIASSTHARSSYVKSVTSSVTAQAHQATSGVVASTSVASYSSATGAASAVITPAPAAPAGCTATAYDDIADIIASCTNIVLDNISAPASSTIDLQKLQDGTTVTFSGTTSFGTTSDSDFDPIVVKGTDITITGAEGHIIDGNGAAYWDGEGSNGGVDKPDHFFVVKDVVNGVISNLNIQNWPTHCFYISGTQGLTVSDLTLDNSAGDASNSLSGSKAAAHNSDGFDISGSDSVTLQNIVVKNQDDCVAVTSGSNILVTGMTCSGGHGLSIGSIGGKSNNTVSGVTFSDSTITNSQNGCRIKSNADTTGTIENISYSNIKMSNITDYGIDIQQDYLNGGSTGEPTNGVTISGVSFSSVTGTTSGKNAYDYYILCGSDSCSDFTFTDVSISGGGETSSCNYPSAGCPS
ncbi:endopolygalacturonase 3 [Sclerotinia borealis F-4128]|uniref:endo-polygalacturonase n=1 Tax=Sclerotinia borealis (strain F-4128) TaxID=1432307 RepID=W9CB55_SCLBF|nr:endopolygalacturonase 3 [Sclerotinia borealis F-4128]